MVKATRSLSTFQPDEIDLVLTHPAQQAVYVEVQRLTSAVNQCIDPGDYFEVQKDVLEVLLELEERRGECDRAATRLAYGKRVSQTQPLPQGRSQDDPEEWQLEAFIYARLARQIRSVADGLAWRAFGFDRRPIIALSRNQGAGPMAGKVGLDFELGHVEHFYRETGQFALLHDMTNCLRIADVTEFHADGKRMFAEVKATGRRRTQQTRRAQQAVDALSTGGHLPGAAADEYLFQLQVPYRNNLSQLTDLLGLAEERGCQGMKLSQGRALVGINLLTVTATHDTDPDGENVEGTLLWDRERSAALKRAGLTRAIQTVRAFSIDTAARSPIQPPFTIYPLDSATSARLVCDYVGFESILSVDALAGICDAHDLDVTVELPEASVNLVGQDHVLRVSRGGFSFVVHDHALGQLLFELVEPESWAAGLREMLDTFNMTSFGTTAGLTPAGRRTWSDGEHPVPVFAGETMAWT